MFHTQRASSQSQVQHSHAEPHLGTGQVRQLQSVVCPARRQRDALRGVRKRHATGLSRHARFGLSFQKVGDLGYYAGSSMNKGSIPGGHRKTQSMHPRYKTESLMAGRCQAALYVVSQMITDMALFASATATAPGFVNLYAQALQSQLEVSKTQEHVRVRVHDTHAFPDPCMLLRWPARRRHLVSRYFGSSTLNPTS